MQGEILDSDLSTRGLTRLLLDLGQHVFMECLTAEGEVAGNP